MSLEQIFTIALLIIAGGFFGALAMWIVHRLKVGSYQTIGNEIIGRAELEAKLLKKSADLEIQAYKDDLIKKTQEKLAKEKSKLTKTEERVKEREDKLEHRLSLFEKKFQSVEKKEAVLEARKGQLEEEKRKIAELESKLTLEIEKATELSPAEAKQNFLERIEKESRNEAMKLIQKIREEAEHDGERIATRIILTSINRLAVPTVSEVAVTSLQLPTDDMKARIIGKDGRNIRTLERMTGVNFLIDETPGVVIISGFDPIRKAVAKEALQELVKDGRIHPSRIEELVAKAQSGILKKIRAYGEDAAMRSGAIGLHPELLDYLGKLKFRLSYGQNVLEHSLEVSHLMGSMAAELGLDIGVAKRIGLLHDIGKAATHEMEGTHALIGRDLALRYGENEIIANGIGCHHEEIAPISAEGALCGPADRISASRPGARLEEAEEYFKRQKKLEELAYEFPGIEQAYALQAGREIRVVVMPDMIDDQGTFALARDLSKRIEQKINCPGKVKVTVIREKRAIEYAI